MEVADIFTFDQRKPVVGFGPVRGRAGGGHHTLPESQAAEFPEPAGHVVDRTDFPPEAELAQEGEGRGEGGRLQKEESIAALTPRSMAGSATVRPPAMLKKTSWSPSWWPPCRSSTARMSDSLRGLMPDATRWGRPKWDLLTSACTSTTSILLPSMIGVTAVPTCGSCRFWRKNSDAFATSERPRSDMASSADFTGGAVAVLGRTEDPVLVGGVPFEGDDGVDHVFQHPRARDGAFLGDMADQEQDHAGGFRASQQERHALPDLGDAPRRAFELLGEKGLDRIDHDDARFPVGEDRQDRLGRGLGRDLHRRAGHADAVGPQGDLFDRFLPGDVDRRHPVGRPLRHELEEERRFPYSRIAGKEHHRAVDKTSAEDAVDFRHPAADPRCIARRGRGGECGHLGRRGAGRAGRSGNAGGLPHLGDRVPGPAIVAPAHPFGERFPAFGADVNRFHFPVHGHQLSASGRSGIENRRSNRALSADVRSFFIFASRNWSA